jgi:hypothetical protein
MAPIDVPVVGDPLRLGRWIWAEPHRNSNFTSSTVRHTRSTVAHKYRAMGAEIFFASLLRSLGAPMKPHCGDASSLTATFFSQPRREYAQFPSRARAAFSARLCLFSVSVLHNVICGVSLCPATLSRKRKRKSHNKLAYHPHPF